MTTRYWVYLVLSLIICLVLACEERLTKTEWLAKYPPDANEVKSILAIDTQSALIAAKVKEAANDAGLSRLFILGLAGGIAGLIILAFFGLTKLSFIPIAVIAGCLTGVTFLKMESQYPKFLPYVGVIAIIGSVGAAVVYYIKHSIAITAVTDVVKNVETIKASMTQEPNKSALDGVLQKQADSTKSLIAKVRASL
jgi:xanthosine utilization system XapX-like protein